MRKTKTIKGFTLVELAIVLVVVGLLVGGVLQGQELIKQAQIRSVVSQIQSLDTSLNTFRAKYRSTPGDTRFASSYGLNCPKTGVACSASTDNVAATESDTNGDGLDGDGDGDNNLEEYWNIGYSNEYFSGELLNFWIHLSNALLVKGTYTANPDGFDGYEETQDCNLTTGSSFPETSLGSGIIALTYAGKIYWINGLDSYSESSILPTVNDLLQDTQLMPEEDFGIDSKIDDGNALTGIVSMMAAYNLTNGFSRYHDGGSTTECFEITTGIYNLALDQKLCSIAVKASG